MDEHLTRHAELRAKKLEFADRLMKIDPSKRNNKPADNGFTPAELMEHMAKAEEFNLVFLRKVSPKQIEGRKVKPGPFYNFVLKSFQTLKRTSAPPMLKPSKQPDIDSAYSQWKSHLDEVEKFLGQVSTPSAPFVKMNFLFGTLSADQFLTFQEAHVHYHEHYFPK